MDLSSSTESSDRVLQVSSGKTGETWLKNHAVKKRSLALLQQTCGVASDEENSGVETPIRSNSPPVQFQELSYNYKCELNSPRYVEYRRKQNKRNHTEERPQVWPDAVEEAFHDALRIIRGRRRTYNGQQKGTNELISAYIMQRTGVLRPRKQVSSHLQVLKPFLRDNEEWMALVTREKGSSEEEEEEGQEGHLSITPLNEMANFDMGVSQRYPYLSPPPNESEKFDLGVSQRYLHMNTPPLPPEILSSSQRSLIRRIKLEMFISGPESEKLHVYTSLQSENGSISRRLEDIPDWQPRFPRLVSYFDRGSLNEDIILFETSFKLMKDHPPIKNMGSQTPIRSKLVADFTVDIDQGSQYMNWECYSRFYEKGVLKESLGTSIKSESLPLGQARVDVLHLSQWWVGRFANIIKERLQKEDYGVEGGMREDVERTRQQIQDITAIQEIWATAKAGGSSPQRMTVFLWDFRECQGYETPTTTWSKVIVPATKPELYSPLQPSTPFVDQPATAIDTVPQHHDFLQPTPLYAECFNPHPLFGENSEKFFAGVDSRFGSPSLVLQADSQSFPSAASVSFSSSNQHSGYSVETSHDSSRGNQSSVLNPESDTHLVQEMGFGHHDSDYSSHHLKCSSEELIPQSSHTSFFCPQGADGVSCSPQASPECYHQLQEAVARAQEFQYRSSTSRRRSISPRDHPMTDHAVGEISPPLGDFSGMHIQLCYAEPEEARSGYGTPYITPPGGMEASEESDQVGFNSHGHHAVPNHEEGHYPEPLDLEQWQAMDQAVRWANAQFSNGEYEEVGDMIEDKEAVMEDDNAEVLRSDMEVELGTLWNTTEAGFDE